MSVATLRQASDTDVARLAELVDAAVGPVVVVVKTRVPNHVGREVFSADGRWVGPSTVKEVEK